MSIVIALLLIVACTVIHYEILWRLNRLLPRLHIVPRRASVLIAVFGAMFSHFCQILLFAAVYYFTFVQSGVALSGTTESFEFGQYLYFSTETYTSLGYGDVYPVESLRLLVGVESITGLLMISWSASFTYLEMNRFWSEAPRRPAAT